MTETIRMLIAIDLPDGDVRTPGEISRHVGAMFGIGLVDTDRGPVQGTVRLITPEGAVIGTNLRLVEVDENDDQLTIDQLAGRVLTAAGDLSRRAREEAGEDEFPIDMERVAELIRTVHGIENAFVENTGGGTATIFAGPTRDDPSYGPRYAAMAGPGTYRDGDPRQPFGDLADFYIGPDDDGDAIPVRPPVTATPELIAALIAAQAKLADPTQALGADDLERLGLDPGLRTAKMTAPEYTEE